MVTMTETLHETLDIPSAWKGSDMVKSSEWIYELSSGELAELDEALRHVKKKGLRIPDIGRDDFPLPSLSAVLGDMLRELETGRGFVLIRGLPVDRYGDDDASTIYWGIGRHFGSVPAQNMAGDLLGHVRASGRNWDVDPTVRGYQTTSYLPFHCDKGDVVGLLCLQTAKSGGKSCIASAVAIHNAIIGDHPEFIGDLYAPLYVDLRGEELAGEDPYYVAPVFSYHGGRLFTRLGRVYVESAQRFAEVPRLKDSQIEAMKLVETLAWSDEFRLDMTFERGDMQFLNNHLIMHSRTEYEDFDEPRLRRHLLRMLIHTAGYRDVPASVEHLNKIVHAWGERSSSTAAPVG